ncbi:PREDICTED: uncharacterized protein LOC109238045 [Nicotiana attenuata]|uniref:uncharacterized protein LOC109238045 n=1 Tax=Nicotiana attenuata TaxID=49451 RepID=UPI00090538AD|nr:PREDICTED: uncharacterized protein LOC109238045 [Nicotiana attenuata]
MAVTTRCGKGGNAPTSSQRQLVDEEQVMQEKEIPNNDEESNDKVEIDINHSVEETQEEVNPSRDHINDMPEPVVQKVKAPLPKPPPPYPQRLAKQNGENQFTKFIQMMKSLSINGPLVEALHQTRLCEVHEGSCDKEAIFKILGIGQASPTSMRLQMADSTTKRPLGVIEDALVCVDKFIPLVDFVILDCEVDYEVPIILGRPFLVTGKAICDVEAGELTFCVSDEKKMVRSRGRGDTSNGRGEPSRGRGKSALPLSLQKIITKKTTSGRGRGA